MVQTFDFVSKNHKHVLIQKVTFLTKKRALDTAIHKKTLHQHTKTYVYTSQTMLYLHTNFLEYTETFLCPHSVSHLQQPSRDW